MSMPMSISATPTAQWEEYRKRARKYESQLYSKLCDYAAKQHQIKQQTNPTETNSTFPSATNEHDMSVEKEIEQLLNKLNECTDSMQRLLQNEPTINNDSNTYTVQRYRSIWHDYTQEFGKTREAIHAAIQRAQLLEGARNSSGSSVNSLRPRTEQLLREKTSLHSSIQMTDDVIAQAMEAKQSLSTQALIFNNVTRKLGALGKRFPILNQLMGRITTRQQRDMIIIAIVIAICLFITFVYIMHK